MFENERYFLMSIHWVIFDIKMAVSILILSDKNETRGPVLEGWMKYYCKDDATVKSAGLKAGKLNLVAAKAMMEAVIDITKHQSVSLKELENSYFDWVITLTTEAKATAERVFPKSEIVFHPVEHPLNEADEDMEKLKKHRKTANELEEFCIEFVHKNIRKLI